MYSPNRASAPEQQTLLIIIFAETPLYEDPFIVRAYSKNNLLKAIVTIILLFHL